MTTKLPLPSTQIAKEKAAPKMRFLYPLAAVCIAVVFLAPGNSEAAARPAPVVQTATVATLEDGAFMRAQCEPITREQHAGQVQLAMMNGVKVK